MAAIGICWKRKSDRVTLLPTVTAHYLQDRRLHNLASYTLHVVLLDVPAISFYHSPYYDDARVILNSEQFSLQFLLFHNRVLFCLMVLYIGHLFAFCILQDSTHGLLPSRILQWTPRLLQHHMATSIMALVSKNELSSHTSWRSFSELRTEPHVIFKNMGSEFRTVGLGSSH